MAEPWYFKTDVWRRHLVDEILVHWLEHAVDREHGGYVSEFDRSWNPTGVGTKTLVSQTRLIFNFCVGYRHTTDDAYRDAADHGLAFLKAKFADTHHGGWYWQCGRDGTVEDDSKVAYGHAFAIFALAEYARTFSDDSASELAAATLEVMDTRLGDEINGGCWTTATRDWQPETDRRSQNPHMHLLEALLSLHAETDDGVVLSLARALCDMAYEKYIHPEHGCLEELFGETWTRLDDDQAAPIEIGHQFEWAWLLNRMADRTGNGHYRQMANGLLGWAVRVVASQQQAGIAGQADRTGRITSETRTFWPQSEALRALLYDACVGSGEHTEALARCAGFVWDHCVDHERGGWYTSVDQHGKPINSDKGGLWKLDYHAVSLCDEALRLLSLDSLA